MNIRKSKILVCSCAAVPLFDCRFKKNSFQTLSKILQPTAKIIVLITKNEVNIYEAVIPLYSEKNDDVSSNYTFSPRAFAIRRCPWAYFICRKNFRHHNTLHGHEKYFPVFVLMTGISCYWFMAKNVVFDYNDNRNFVRLEVMAYAEP